MAASLHPIQVVVERTGLSAHVIRIWEKRYGAVTPQRTESRRRLYSEEEIERLALLRRLADAGHGIGYIARLPAEKLQLLADEAPPIPRATGPDLPERAAPDRLLDAALAAVHALDAPTLRAVLETAARQLGGQGVLQRVIGPLAHAIGERWRDGTLTAAHEHFATAVLRLFLGYASRQYAGSSHAPVLVVATPAGQLHELGALIAGAAAANLGWHVVYLGASLPAAEIAGAARQHRARAVALSLVYPEDDPTLDAELGHLAALLAGTTIVAGGRAMPAYRPALDKIGAHMPASLSEYGALLDRLRRLRGPADAARLPPPPVDSAT